MKHRFAQMLAAAAVLGMVPTAPVREPIFHRSPNGFRGGKWLRDRRKAKRRQARKSRQINRGRAG